LSIPAANPTALGNLTSKHSTARPFGADTYRPSTDAAKPSIAIETSCAASGANRKSKGRAKNV
jgi:hypothetical protein